MKQQPVDVVRVAGWAYPTTTRRCNWLQLYGSWMI